MSATTEAFARVKIDGSSHAVEGGPSFKVRFEWDSDNRCYSLAIGCEIVDLEQVSQRALEDWFFYKFD